MYIKVTGIVFYVREIFKAHNKRIGAGLAQAV
jgi:hypothetical protein